jgi:hypothetical protein
MEFGGDQGRAVKRSRSPVNKISHLRLTSYPHVSTLHPGGVRYSSRMLRKAKVSALSLLLIAVITPLVLTPFLEGGNGILFGLLVGQTIIFHIPLLMLAIVGSLVIAKRYYNSRILRGIRAHRAVSLLALGTAITVGFVALVLILTTESQQLHSLLDNVFRVASRSSLAPLLVYLFLDLQPYPVVLVVFAIFIFDTAPVDSPFSADASLALYWFLIPAMTSLFWVIPAYIVTVILL